MLDSHYHWATSLVLYSCQTWSHLKLASPPFTLLKCHRKALLILGPNLDSILSSCVTSLQCLFSSVGKSTASVCLPLWQFCLLRFLFRHSWPIYPLLSSHMFFARHSADVPWLLLHAAISQMLFSGLWRCLEPLQKKSTLQKVESYPFHTIIFKAWQGGSHL